MRRIFVNMIFNFSLTGRKVVLRMKKSKKRLTFAKADTGIADFSGLTACSLTGQDPAETVYDPSQGEKYEPVEEVPQEVYGPPIESRFNPPEEVIQDIGSRLDPPEEVIQDIYGPPIGSRLDPPEEVIQDIYGPPVSDRYNPEDEEREIVYGPPLWEYPGDLLE